MSGSLNVQERLCIWPEKNNPALSRIEDATYVDPA
jgi:hypothetical protein